MIHEMNRRSFLKGSAAVAASTAVPLTAIGQSQKPNIIFFMVDQLSAKWLWGPAAKSIHTPHFDSLRARGVAFHSTCVSNPICAASRACLSTGLYSRNHGVLQNGYDLDLTIPTFMRELQRGGWATGAFGKVHHHPQFASVHPDYRPYGFDVVFNTEDARAGYWTDWVAQEQPKEYDAVLATVWAAAIPELKAYGPQKIDLSAKIKEIRKNFRWATSNFPHNTAGHYTLPFPAYTSQTEWITRHALDFIRKSDMSKPIYAHISYIQPHSPWCSPEEYMKNVDESKIPPPAPIEWENDPLHPKCFPLTEGAHSRIPEDWRANRHYYMADLTYLDAQLGMILGELEKTGRLDNTYLILLSDHGELFYDHGFTGKGERHYDACVRVPLMISGPGLQKGLDRYDLVHLEDIFPTVMEMAGLAMPQPVVKGHYLKRSLVAENERYPGKSLMPLCRGEQPDKWRDQLEIESYNNIGSTTPEFWARTVRTKDWRYTLYPENSGEQMFSLKEDPDEQKNLAGDPGYARVRTEMRDRLLEEIILQDYPHTQRDRFSLGVF